MKSYDDVLQYLYNLEKTGIIFGLDNIRWILDTIGNPHARLKTIHIGGTNGKGSVATILSYIIKDAGYKVGKYTSPHLVSFTERIAINEQEIGEDDVIRLANHIRRSIESVQERHSFTFFDFTTSLAFEYFNKNNVDVAIIEVGLGGRLDSTNVIEPLVTVITNVNYDHTDYLGKSLEDIAKEKSGIIKKGVPVVTGADGSIVHIIEATAKELGSPVYMFGSDFFYKKIGENKMSYRGLNKTFPQVDIKLKGDHQFVNVSIALCVVEILLSSGFSINEASVFKALSEVTLKGRLEFIKDKPLILLDCAHNPSGIYSLYEYLKTYHKDRRIIVIFGVMKDKDYHSMLDTIKACANTVILTRPQIDRALLPDSMKHVIPDAVLTDNVKSALLEAKKHAYGDDMIVITGSFYTAGEAKELINEIF
ncbi:MAG TPA: bifunctional folylpolyglutamate synthase/dihydrofolate synthase [Deltaproteobacteria bacterium]|nr:bifunctional folylpolyglutamate synthase/dihydrofolate synthase [Deltaproteobacteria bacterium]